MARTVTPRTVALGTAALLGLILLLSSSSAASADILVTTAGERIETRGPWRVEGARVSFTRPNGTLSALRLSEVDIDASERATRAAAAGTQTAAAARSTNTGKPALVLDNEGMPKASRRAAEPDPQAGEPGVAGGTGRVSVLSWQETSEPGDELTFSGVVRNDTKDFASDIQLLVTVYDETGAPTATQTARLQKSALPPGGSTTFEVQFPGLYITKGTKFEVRHRGFVAGSNNSPETPQGPTEGEG
jgi:hypothetical protein